MFTYVGDNQNVRNIPQNRRGMYASWHRLRADGAQTRAVISRCRERCGDDLRRRRYDIGASHFFRRYRYDAVTPNARAALLLYVRVGPGRAAACCL